MITFYFDEMMPRPVANEIAKNAIEVVMAVFVEMIQKDDLGEHLPYATEKGYVLVTCDRKFAGLAAQTSDHAGLICWTGDNDDYGGMVKRLSEFAEQHTSEAVRGQVFWLK